MWLYTPFGFFSIVHGRDADVNLLVVRSRVASDLTRLRDEYLPELSPTTASAHTDYAYRGTCTKEQFASAAAKIALAIDYTNFKDEVTRVQGDDRHDIYSEVWWVNLQMKKIDRKEMTQRLRAAGDRAHARSTAKRNKRKRDEFADNYGRSGEALAAQLQREAEESAPKKKKEAKTGLTPIKNLC